MVLVWILRHLAQMFRTRPATIAQPTAPLLKACVLEDRVLYSATILPIDWLLDVADQTGVVPPSEVDAIMEQLRLELDDASVPTAPLAVNHEQDAETIPNQADGCLLSPSQSDDSCASEWSREEHTELSSTIVIWTQSTQADEWNWGCVLDCIENREDLQHTVAPIPHGFISAYLGESGPVTVRIDEWVSGIQSSELAGFHALGTVTVTGLNTLEQPVHAIAQGLHFNDSFADSPSSQANIYQYATPRCCQHVTEIQRSDLTTISTHVSTSFGSKESIDEELNVNWQPAVQSASGTANLLNDNTPPLTTVPHGIQDVRIECFNYTETTKWTVLSGGTAIWLVRFGQLIAAISSASSHWNSQSSIFVLHSVSRQIDIAEPAIGFFESCVSVRQPTRRMYQATRWE